MRHGNVAGCTQPRHVDTIGARSVAHTLAHAVLALALVASLPAAAAGKMSAAQSAEFNQAFERGAKVRAIVRLKSAEVPEPRRSSAGRTHFRSERALSLRSASGTAAMSEKAQATMQRLGRLPLVAMEVTPADLARLGEMADVASIRVDRLLSPALDEIGPQLGAPFVHDLGAVGEGRMVAVLDTGFDLSNPSFSGKDIVEACFSFTSENSFSLCPSGEEVEYGPGSSARCDRPRSCGHGTNVAVAAVGNDPKLSGMAPAAGLVAITVFSRVKDRAVCGRAYVCLRVWESSLLAALEYVDALREDLPIAAVNLSLGGEHYESVAACDAAHPAHKSLIDRLRSDGIPTVIAAGNGSVARSIATPACISSAVAVGGTDKYDELSFFTSRANWLAAVAPAERVTTPTEFGGVRDSNGTSLAAPLVAGAYAALASLHPGRTLAEIEAAILTNGVDVYDRETGHTYPRLDLAAANDALDAGRPYTTITVVDDEDGESTRGQFERSSVQRGAYGGTLRRSPRGSDSVFTYSVPLEQSGEYRMQGWWPAFRDGADDTQLAVRERSGTKLTFFDQRFASRGWKDLGVYRFDSQAEFSLSSRLRGRVTADGFRLQFVRPVTPVRLSTRALGSALARWPFLRNLSASGGTEPYRFAVTDGYLPDGIALDCERGAVRGTAMRSGSFPVEMTVFDSHGESASRNMSVRVVDDGGTVPARDSRVVLDSITATTVPAGRSEERMYIDAYNCGSRRALPGSTMSWEFAAPETGHYDVEVLWRRSPDLSANVQVVVRDSRELMGSSLDQRAAAGGDGWKRVGSARLVARRDATLQVRATDRPFSVDAVRLVPQAR